MRTIAAMAVIGLNSPIVYMSMMWPMSSSLASVFVFVDNVLAGDEAVQEFDRLLVTVEC